MSGAEAIAALQDLAGRVAAHRPAVAKLADTLRGATALMRSTGAESVVEAIDAEAKRRALAELRGAR